MILKAVMLLVIGSILWTIVGVSMFIEKNEQIAIKVAQIVMEFLCRMFRKVAKGTVNFAINFGTFAEGFYDGAMETAVNQYENLKESLKYGVKLRKELNLEYEVVDDYEGEVVSYSLTRAV